MHNRQPTPSSPGNDRYSSEQEEVGVNLADRHSFGLSVRASRWINVQSYRQLHALISNRLVGDLPIEEQLILGDGTNTIFLNDYPGLILHSELKGVSLIGANEGDWLIDVGSGERWHDVVKWSINAGLGGLENLALIPGTIGAAPVQNIGAYGLELSERLFSVSYVDLKTGLHHTLPAQECALGYRTSRFKTDLAQRALITKVTLRLPMQWQAHVDYQSLRDELASKGQDQNPTALQIFNAVVRVRRRRLPDPNDMGNAGSFFKNPVVSTNEYHRLKAQLPGLVAFPADQHVKLSAGWLIEQAGLKGKTIGDAAVSDQHALVLVNRRQATTQDLAALISWVQSTVWQRYGIELEPEPLILGRLGKLEKAY